MNRAIENFVNKVELMGYEDEADAISLLKSDHRKVELLLNEYLAGDGRGKKQLIDTIIEELSIHASVEEDLVYPLLESSQKNKISEAADEAEEEHHVLKMALADLADANLTPRQMKAKVMVVRDLVKHHVKEEESTLLPELKRTVDDLDLLGVQILARKQELKDAVKSGGGIGKNKDRKQLATTSRNRNVGTSKAKPTSRRVSRKASTSRSSTRRKSA